MSSTPAARGRFVYITEADVSVDNGPGINEREFVAALLRRHGDQVVCVLPEPRQPDVFHDARIRYVKAHGGMPFRYPRYLVDAKRAVDSLLREGPIAALVFRPGATPLLPFTLTSSKGPPVLLKKLGLYSIFGEESTRSRVKNAISRSFLPMYRSVIRRALAADVESAVYVDWLHERFGIEPHRMRVIPNGVNTNLFKPGDLEEERRIRELEDYDTVVGYVGALSRIRRVDTLLKAFADLGDRGNAGLVLIGSGPDEDSLRAEAEELGLRSHVRFVGPVPYSSVPGWIRCFDVAVDPTAVRMKTRNGVRTASFSQKIGQYLASGIPVLAWRCRDTDFLDDEGVGRTATYPDSAGFGLALQDLVEQVTRSRGSVTASARRVGIERFDSESLADQRFSWWQEVVDQQGGMSE